LNVFGEQTTKDIYLASLVNHGAGSNMVTKIEIGVDDKAKLYVQCKDEDWKLYTEELAAEDSTIINIGRYAECISELFGLIRHARRNGGCWTKYTKGDYGRTCGKPYRYDKQ